MVKPNLGEGRQRVNGRAIDPGDLTGERKPRRSRRGGCQEAPHGRQGSKRDRKGGAIVWRCLRCRTFSEIVARRKLLGYTEELVARPDPAEALISSSSRARLG
jgi:hypothetical protein